MSKEVGRMGQLRRVEGAGSAVRLDVATVPGELRHGRPSPSPASHSNRAVSHSIGLDVSWAA